MRVAIVSVNASNTDINTEVTRDATATDDFIIAFIRVVQNDISRPVRLNFNESGYTPVCEVLRYYDATRNFLTVTMT